MSATGVAFNENILRSITALRPDQQTDLVRWLSLRKSAVADPLRFPRARVGRAALEKARLQSPF